MEIIYTTEEELNNETSKELKARIESLNVERGVEHGDGPYVPVSGKKGDLIERLMEDQRLNVQAKGSAADTTQSILEVSLDQLESHPDNERHAIDYHDPQLMNSLVQTNGQFMSVPRVVDSGKTLADGRTVYYILAGNRSTTTFKRYNEERGIDLKDVKIPVMLRAYEGTEKQKRAQELMEISLDNDTHKIQSPIEKARQFKRLQDEAGMTQGAIAKREGIYGSQVSAMMKYLLLPQNVQDLIHYGYDSSRYARWSEEDLEKFGVSFYKTEDGEVVVEGISLANAKVMLAQFPRKNSPDFDQACLDLEDFLGREDVVRYAKKLNADKFEKSLVEKLKVVADEQSWTWYEVDEQVGDGSGDTEPSELQEAASGADTEPEQPSSSKALKVEQLDSRTSSEAAQDLRSGAVTLTPDWQDALAEAIEMEESGTLNAFKALFYYDILVYSDTLDD